MSGAQISIRDHGPLRIEGEFRLVDAQGRPFGLGARSAISLCRCGQSANRPFCDGTHGKVGFQSECPARDLG